MAKAKVFRVTGTFHQAHHEQDIRKEIVAETAERAKELLRSTLGSKHGVPRRLIKITEAVEVPIEAVQDPVVRHRAGA